MQVLTVRNLNKNYLNSAKNEIQVLDRLNLDVFFNKITCVLGPSGCGKTTLLNIISGLDDNYNGNVKKEQSLKIGYMFQTPSLIPWRTVWENILLGPEVKWGINDNILSNATQLLEKYALSGFSKFYPQTLSQGMQQRASLIRILLYGANLLLMDEPFSRIDFFTRRKLYKDINDLVIKDNLTVILVTHDVEEAVLLGDKVVVLSDRPATVVNEIEIPIKREERDLESPGVPDNLQPYLKKVWDNLELSKMTKEIKI